MKIRLNDQVLIECRFLMAIFTEKDQGLAPHLQNGLLGKCIQLTDIFPLSRIAHKTSVIWGRYQDGFVAYACNRHGMPAEGSA
jgi:hypothetical protein